MPASRDPSATADHFAKTVLGRAPTQAEYAAGQTMLSKRRLG